MKRIVAFKVLEQYRVWLRFDDGVEGEADFSGKARTGVYAPWQDYKFFRQAHLGQSGELRWDDQLDFCPDALWLKVTGTPSQDLPQDSSVARNHA